MKKLIAFAVLAGGGWWYASTRYEFHDTLVWAKKHPDSKWAPAVDYYVGLVYYQRADFPKSQEAFTQLLTDHPTGYYEAKGLLRLSEVAESNRDWAASREALAKFLEDFPDHPSRQMAEKRLEIVRNR